MSSLVMDAMKGAQARTQARLTVLSALAGLDDRDRVQVLAEVMIEVESTIDGPPAPERRVPERAPASTTPSSLEPLPAQEVKRRQMIGLGHARSALERTQSVVEGSRGPEEEPTATPENPTSALPAPRPGAGTKPTRSLPKAPPGTSRGGNLAAEGKSQSKIFQGKTMREVAEAIATTVKQHPGIGASEIAAQLGSTRDRLTRTIRFATKLKLVVQRGKKSSTRYFPPDDATS